jgi:hypothetical protein
LVADLEVTAIVERGAREVVARALHVGEQLDPRAVGTDQEYVQVFVAGVRDVQRDGGNQVPGGHADGRGDRAAVLDCHRRVVGERVDGRQELPLLQRLAPEAAGREGTAGRGAKVARAAAAAGKQVGK